MNDHIKDIVPDLTSCLAKHAQRVAVRKAAHAIIAKYLGVRNPLYLAIREDIERRLFQMLEEIGVRYG